LKPKWRHILSAACSQLGWQPCWHVAKSEHVAGRQFRLPQLQQKGHVLASVAAQDVQACLYTVLCVSPVLCVLGEWRGACSKVLPGGQLSKGSGSSCRGAGLCLHWRQNILSRRCPTSAMAAEADAPVTFACMIAAKQHFPCLPMLVSSRSTQVLHAMHSMSLLQC
jgi:hypothetical protein